MDYDPIKKNLKSLAVPPNFFDYNKICDRFSWEEVRRELDGLPAGKGLNIAHEAVDRHTVGLRGNRLAIRWLGTDSTVLDFTYGDLKKESNRFANLLAGLGVGQGDRVFTLAGRIPELYIAALGILKNGSVFCPLFSAFGPEPVYQRLSKGNARVLLTTRALYKKKIVPLTERLPLLQHVLLTDVEDDLADGIRSLPKLMAAASTDFTIAPTDPEDPALLHFTSGTTGMPKGAMHVHEAVLTHYLTGKYVLDFHPEDVFWCTADPLTALSPLWSTG